MKGRGSRSLSSAGSPRADFVGWEGEEEGEGERAGGSSGRGFSNSGGIFSLGGRERGEGGGAGREGGRSHPKGSRSLVFTSGSKLKLMKLRGGEKSE